MIVQFDQGGPDDPSALIAFDLESGRELWRTPRRAPNSWSSPAVINTGSRTEIITTCDPHVIAYDPAGGAELWRAEGLGGDVGPSAAFAGGLIFATNDGTNTLAIRAGGSGDVTKTHLAWSTYENTPDTASPLAAGGYLLVALSYGKLLCLGGADGKLAWEHDCEEGFNASPVLAGGRVYAVDLSGVTHVFGLGKAFKEEAACPLGEKVEATPAFAGGRIYIRGEKHLYCIGAGKGKPAGR